MNCLLGAILFAMVLDQAAKFKLFWTFAYIRWIHFFFTAREPYYVRSSLLTPLSMLNSVHMSL
jgi:hypothetical protein